MKAYRLIKPLPIEKSPLIRVDLTKPKPGSGQIRIKVKVCGVCHTDLHIAEGDITPPAIPITPGHQVIGYVDAVGPGITQYKIGDRVGVPWFYDSCGICVYCLSENENLCPKARFTGFHMDGGFGEYMLAEAKNILSVPSEMKNDQAAPLLCAGIIGFRSLRMAELQPGETIGFFGFGASAHISIQVTKYWGCEAYVFTRSQIHRDHALELGAGWVGGAEDTPPKLLDRAVIFAPAGWIVPLALQRIRPGGTLAINAIHMSPIPEMPYDLIYGERTLRSVSNATYQDGVDFLALASKIPIHATITAYDLNEVNQALSDIKNSRINGEAVVIVG